MSATPGELNQRLAPIARRGQELRAKVEGLNGTVYFARSAPAPFPGQVIFGAVSESQIANVPSQVGRVSRQRQARNQRRR